MPAQSNSLIFHIDFDSFFASVAQQDTPALRNRPLAITATNGRTAIIAASREAKARGVKSPSRSFEALSLCPNLLFAPANFVRYFEISKKFLRICSEYSPIVELFSIDEVFMDMTETVHLFGGVDALITILKQRIAKEIGEYITVSIGVSHNKLLAKLASGLNKPNGKAVITENNMDEIYSHVPMSSICGIGRMIEQRLKKIGIYSLLQLKTTPLATLVAEFGTVEGHFLKNVGEGIDTKEVIAYTNAPEVKSISRHYCLPQNTTDRRIVEQHIYELAEEVGIKLRRLNKKAQSVGLYLGGSKQYGGHKHLTDYVDTGMDIWLVCEEFLKKWQPTMVRKIAVWTGSLHTSTSLSLPLFPEEVRKQKLQQVIDTINEEFGDHTIRNGFLLYAQKLTTVPNGFMADTWERTRLAKETETAYL